MPHPLVLNNQAAGLPGAAQVPIVVQSAELVIGAGALIANSIERRNTEFIRQLTPRIHPE